jgi:hypothetical protein
MVTNGFDRYCANTTTPAIPAPISKTTASHDRVLESVDMEYIVLSINDGRKKGVMRKLVP